MLTMAGFNFAELPVWITSNYGGGLWHIGKQTIMIGPKTGKILHVGRVAACNGKQLGGPWGYTTSIEGRGPRCPRCLAIAERN